jgi:hypothetical protein
MSQVIDPRYLGSGAVKNHITKLNATGKMITSKRMKIPRRFRVFQAKIARNKVYTRPRVRGRANCSFNSRILWSHSGTQEKPLFTFSRS